MVHPPLTPLAPSPQPLARWQGRSPRAWAERLGVATAEFHARIGSTNDRARELVEKERPLPAFVLADRQLAGRGRHGRKWASDTPRGLWLTVARPGPGDAAATLPLRVGLAVARALDPAAHPPLDPAARPPFDPAAHRPPDPAAHPPATPATPAPASPTPPIGLKWPNDLILAGCKLGGILCERARGVFLVGIGLNLNQPPDELPRGVAPPATSLLVHTGRTVSRASVLERLADELAAVWPALAPRIPAPELAALNDRSTLRGRRLSVSGVVRHSSQPPCKVEALSATGGPVLADGSLEVRDHTGARIQVIAGSVERRS